MSRSFVLGGVSATGLATGKPFIKRITRDDGRHNADAAPADGLTCQVVAGALDFSVDGAIGTGGKRTDFGTGTGELIFVEFPSTTRTLSVQLEEETTVNADHNIRLRVCLAAEGQVVTKLDSNGAPTAVTETMAPLTNGNFIELSAAGDTATINARTKGVFIYIQKRATAVVVPEPALVPGADDDSCAILVTAVLDHEGFEGSNGVQTSVTTAALTTTTLKKIWHKTDGVG